MRKSSISCGAASCFHDMNILMLTLNRPLLIELSNVIYFVITELLVLSLYEALSL